MIRFFLHLPLRTLKYLVLVVAVILAWENVDPLWRLAVKANVLEPIEDRALELWDCVSDELMGSEDAPLDQWTARPAARAHHQSASELARWDTPPSARSWAELRRDLERLADVEVGR